MISEYSGVAESTATQFAVSAAEVVAILLATPGVQLVTEEG